MSAEKCPECGTWWQWSHNCTTASTNSTDWQPMTDPDQKRLDRALAKLDRVIAVMREWEKDLPRYEQNDRIGATGSPFAARLTLTHRHLSDLYAALSDEVTVTDTNCPSCGCKWKRCVPHAFGSDTGNVVCDYCGTVLGPYSWTDIEANP